MARSKRKQIAYRDFSGGIQTFVSPILLTSDESPLMKNVNNRKPGIIGKTKGFTQVGSTGSSGKIKGLGVFAQSDGTKTLTKVHDTTIYQWGGASWASVYTSLTSNNTDKVFTANAYIDDEDRIYYASGLNDDIVYWNGTTTGTVSSFKAKFIEVFRNKLFFGYVDDGTEYPLRVQFFDSGQDTVVADNYFDDLAEPVTALKEYAGYLYIFGENSIAKYDGYSFGKISTKDGTTSQRSVQIAESRLLWFNKLGVYMYGGDGLPVLISRPIQDWVDAVSSYSEVSARVDEFGRYCLYIGDVTVDGTAYTDVELIYDVLINSWTVADGRPFITGVLLKDDGASTSYTGDTDNDKVWQADNGTANNGNAIASEWQTSKLDADRPDTLKTFYKAYITFKPQNNAEYLTIQYRIDGASSWSNIEGTTNNVAMSGTDTLSTTKLHLPEHLRGRFIQFRITHSSSADDFEIYEIRLEYDIIEE